MKGNIRIIQKNGTFEGLSERWVNWQTALESSSKKFECVQGGQIREFLKASKQEGSSLGRKLPKSWRFCAQRAPEQKSMVTCMIMLPGRFIAFFFPQGQRLLQELGQRTFIPTNELSQTESGLFTSVQHLDLVFLPTIIRHFKQLTKTPGRVSKEAERIQEGPRSCVQPTSVSMHHYIALLLRMFLKLSSERICVL